MSHLSPYFEKIKKNEFDRTFPSKLIKSEKEATHLNVEVELQIKLENTQPREPGWGFHWVYVNESIFFI